MSAVGKIAGILATAAVVYFAPVLAPEVAGLLGVSSPFLTSLIGSAILAAGLYAIQTLFMGGGRRGSDMEAGKMNVRITEPPRWIAAGEVLQGGGVLFAEFDARGNFWYIIVHADSILAEHTKTYLDDIEVSLDGSGNVLNSEFRLKSNKDKDPAETDGEGDPYIRIWTRTHTESDPVPGRVAEFDAAFPSLWTADHKLVGTTYSVVRITALDIEHRWKIYKWRGAMSIGEPAISVAGVWSNVYDPRDSTQTLGDRTTYKPTRNAALIWAWFRTHPYGRRKPESDINWDMIAQQADVCDETIVGIESTQPRYECGIGIAENKQRNTAEQEILMSMDAQIVFDDEGKTWVHAGKWEAPTLHLSRNRDIVAMESVEAENGESETQGVIVRYTDRDARYTPQPSAAWINPIYFRPGETPQFLTVDILGCNNHNQAMRLAKAIGMRSQPRHKIAPLVGLRGLRARKERIVNLTYDNTFAGDYEIATVVELDGAGLFTTFGAVPVDESRWTLLDGEESLKPVVDGTVTSITYPAIVGESLTFTDGRLILTLPALERNDTRYRAQYIHTDEITGGDDPWIEMDINGTIASSGIIPGGADEYTVRYRYVTTSGRGPAWEYDTIVPGIAVQPVSNLTVIPSTGEATLQWKNPNDLNFQYTSGYRNTTSDFGTAIEIFDLYGGGVGEIQERTDTVAAGTYYWWVVAHAGDGTPSTPVGPVTATVS